MSGKLLLIYTCNFHVLSHFLLIYICKLHWNPNARFFPSFTTATRPKRKSWVQICPRRSQRRTSCCIPTKRPLTASTLTAMQRSSSGVMSCSVCNFLVLSNLLLIYICKLHWNLNTMFVCQVNYLLFKYVISMS